MVIALQLRPPAPRSSAVVRRARCRWHALELANEQADLAGPVENEQWFATPVARDQSPDLGLRQDREPKHIPHEERRECLAGGRSVVSPSAQQPSGDHAPQAGPAAALDVD